MLSSPSFAPGSLIRVLSLIKGKENFCNDTHKSHEREVSVLKLVQSPMCPTCSQSPFAFWTSSTISPTLQLMEKLLVFTATPPRPALTPEAIPVPISVCPGPHHDLHCCPSWSSSTSVPVPTMVPHYVRRYPSQSLSPSPSYGAWDSRSGCG